MTRFVFDVNALVSAFPIEESVPGHALRAERPVTWSLPPQSSSSSIANDGRSGFTVLSWC